MVADALIEAAARKVSVFLLADGYASQVMSKIYRFTEGIRHSVSFFEPLFRSRNFYFGRRMHHKIFLWMPVMPWLGASTYPIITMIYPAKGLAILHCTLKAT